MGGGRRARVWVAALGVLALVTGLILHVGRAGGASGSYCASCHEIRPSHDQWARSSHRDMPCSECHGTLLSSGFHSLKENAKRAFRHVSTTDHEHIALDEAQTIAMIHRCERCHRQQFADWTSSGHSMTYADVFLNPTHNQTEQVNDDCLRCHGMFFRGTVRDIVAPLSTQGPWKLRKEELRQRPAIPCLACHQIHLTGQTAQSPNYSDPRTIALHRELRSRPVAFYDRREATHFTLEELPKPRLERDGKPLRVAPDPRQNLCYQCHAPDASHRAGTSDDRTPRGVHEGLSCFSCHETHSMDARRSCGNCHPALSNCGLDVTKMDTTFHSQGSTHNIHFVACADCHPKGVPLRRKR